MVITSSAGVVWDFAVYRHLNGYDLPARIREEAVDYNSSYEPCHSLDLIRRKEVVELTLTCCYPCGGSVGGFRLQEFLPVLMVNLQQTRRVRLDLLFNYDLPPAFLRV